MMTDATTFAKRMPRIGGSLQLAGDEIEAPTGNGTDFHHLNVIGVDFPLKKIVANALEIAERDLVVGVAQAHISSTHTSRILPA